jgi:hypothetical protein
MLTRSQSLFTLTFLNENYWLRYDSNVAIFPSFCRLYLATLPDEDQEGAAGKTA